MMNFDSRQTRRLLDRMGVQMEEIPNVREVIIRTDVKEMVVRDASVYEVRTKGARIFQVSGSSVEEKASAKPTFSEEDVLLVAQQANVSPERARQALIESEGRPAEAILKLTS